MSPRKRSLLWAYTSTTKKQTCKRFHAFNTYKLIKLDFFLFSQCLIEGRRSSWRSKLNFWYEKNRRVITCQWSWKTDSGLYQDYNKREQSKLASSRYHLPPAVTTWICREMLQIMRRKRRQGLTLWPQHHLGVWRQEMFCTNTIHCTSITPHQIITGD